MIFVTDISDRRLVSVLSFPPVLTKAVLSCAVIASAVVAVASAVGAAAAGYGQWDTNAGTVVVPVANFPGAHFSTDSVNPSTASGNSAFLNSATPFGATFGSSYGQSYELLRLAQGRQPSHTSIEFGVPLAPGTWGLALGDVDAESVRVQGFDANGVEVPVGGLGFQGTFNACAGSPSPGACGGAPGTDVPVWSASTGSLVGNGPDTNGASGWFRPTAAVKTLVLTASLNQGIPAYQVWLAAFDQPKKERQRVVPPPFTPDDTPVTVQVCDGAAKSIDLLGRPVGGKVVTHPAACSVTYTPAKGFEGVGEFTVKITEPNGKVLVKSFEVRVGKGLAATGAGQVGPLAEGAAALVFAGAGLVFFAVRRRTA